MKKITRIVLASIVIAIVLAIGITAAASDHGARAGMFSVFAICTILAFVINWLAFIPANIAKTEHYYDLTGSFTYLSMTAAAVALSPNLDARSMLVAAMVVIWAVRLGTFLFSRIKRDGKDDRFDDIKSNALRFFLTWTLQATWVVITASCAMVIITSTHRVPLEAIGLLGISIWAIGLVIEIVADRQKSSFKRDRANEGKFIKSGIWSWSRHPNYFGEILLWCGMAIVAVPVFKGLQWITLISPVFVYLLISRISGVNKLEDKADEKWGGDQDYIEYKTRTSILVPMPPK